MNIQPRVRFQAQFFHQRANEWWDADEPRSNIEDAKIDAAYRNNKKTRILKTTTTFEVVEEMEPSK